MVARSNGLRVVIWGIGTIFGATMWQFGVVWGGFQWDPIPGWKVITFPQLSPVTWALAAIGIVAFLVGIFIRRRELQQFAARRRTRESLRRNLRWS